MITRIEIENFKGISERVAIDLKSVTLLFGANGAGKSTVLHALHYAYEVLAHRNVDADRVDRGGMAVDLGGFTNMVHRHDRSRSIRIQIAFDLGSERLQEVVPRGPVTDADVGYGTFVDVFNKAKSAWAELCVSWDTGLQAASLSGLRFGLDGSSLASLFWNREHDPDRALVVNEYADHMRDWIGEYEEIPRLFWWKHAGSPVQAMERNLELIDPEEVGLGAMAGAASAAPALYAAAVGCLLSELTRCAVARLSSLIHVGPLREIPPRGFRPERAYLPSRWINGLAAWDAIYKGEIGKLEYLNDWMRELGTGYHFERRRIASLTNIDPATMHGGASDLMRAAEQRMVLSLIDTMAGIPVAPHDIGVGISQMVPVVVAALWPLNQEHAALVAVEQPELHIHPRIQARLGDLLISAADWSVYEELEARGQFPERASFLIETHSEHLVLRLMRRIRETNEIEDGLPPNGCPFYPHQLAVYYVERDEDNRVRFVPLRVSPDGEFIDRWPGGFFEERAEELF